MGKPANIMVFNGVLKLIDVEGCVKIGSKVSVWDSSLSFSACYCAPEFAAFCIEDSDEPIIQVSAALDVWSVGITICELVTLDPILKKKYAMFHRRGGVHNDGGFQYLEWLSMLTQPHMPGSIEEFDVELAFLVKDLLCVCDPVNRKSLAESLSCDYLTKKSKRNSGPLSPDDEEEEHNSFPSEVPRHIKRLEDCSDKVLYKGTLWKLNSKGNPSDPNHWILRDMWIANNGSLCYFSTQEDKRLVLLDQHELARSEISKYTDGCKDHAFQVKTLHDHDSDFDLAIFASESNDHYTTWTRMLETAGSDEVQTLYLGTQIAQGRNAFRLRVRNRRTNLGQDDENHAVPVFKGKLWKLKAEADRMSEGGWREREMWISKLGSLVYRSVKEEKNLVYYTTKDISTAKLTRIPSDQSCKPWTFQVHLQPHDGVEFEPGDFAAESEDMRENWIKEIERFAGSR